MPAPAVVAEDGILVLIFLAIIVAGFFLDWKRPVGSARQGGKVEVGLKTQYAEKKKRAINFDLYVQQLSEVEQSFGALSSASTARKSTRC
jgi:type IV pilus assembly protein PilO